MYTTATDDELVRMGHRQGPTVRLYAQRLEMRTQQAEQARASLEDALRTTRDDATRVTLLGVLRMIDWRYDVPGHDQMTVELRRENRVREVTL